jgi:hypothetical protein
MTTKSKLDAAAEKLLHILEGAVKNLPEAEKEARWRTLHEKATSLETRAKQQARSKNAGESSASP